MDFQDQDRVYYNSEWYAGCGTADRFLDYFLQVMRGYDLMTSHSKSNFSIEAYSRGSYLITNTKTEERFYNRNEYIYRCHSFELISI
jgi:hypothetical protein